MDNLFYVMAIGLPGTGKTTNTKYLQERLGFNRFDPISTRRELGRKKYDPADTAVYDYFYQGIHNSLILGISVLVEANNATKAFRQVDYDFANKRGVDVIVIEHICSEDRAKNVICGRKQNSDLISDTADPEVYDRIRDSWEDSAEDLQENPDISLVRYNTEALAFQDIRINQRVADFVSQIKFLLLEYGKTLK